MSTVIRDVVIRVGIQNGQSTLSMSGVQQAVAATQTLTTTTDAASTAAASMWANLKGPTASEAIKETEAIAKSIEEVRTATKELQDQAKQDQAIKDNAEKLKKSQNELTTAYMQVGEASKLALSGAMSLARSYAYLTAASEDDLKSAMQLIATVEGVAHSVTGTIDVVSGLVKVYRAMELAGKAAAASNMLLLASQRAVSAAGTGGVAGAVGGAASGTVGAGGSIAGFAAFKLALAQGASAVGLFAAKFMALPVALAAVGTEIIDRLSGGGGFLSVLDEWAKENRSTKATADMQAKSVSRFDMAQAAEGRFSEQSTLQAQIRAAQGTTASGIASVGAVTPQQQMEAINKQRAMARQELADAQAEIAQAEQNAAQRRAAGQAPLMAEMTSALERQKTAAEQMQQIEERRLSALRSGQDLLRAQRDQQVAAMQTAQQALQLEQDKNKSLAVRFAQLTEIEQAQLRSINEQLKGGGQLKEQDVAFLEQKGFGQKVTEDFRVQQAQAAGFGNLVDGLGGGGAEREKQLQDQVKARQKQIDQMTGQILESQGQIEQAEASLVTAINGQGEATIKALQAAHDAIQKQKERLDRMQQMSRN